MPAGAPAARPGARVAIVHQGFVPIYRKAFFERLAAAGEIEYVVFHGQAPRASGHEAAAGPFAFPNVRVENRELGPGGRLVVQPIVSRIARGGFAAVVAGAELKLPAGLAAGGVVRAQGGALVLWGQGHEKAEDGSGVLSVAGQVIKAGLARRADGYLVYTEGGARELAVSGVDPGRVTVVQNTLDMEAQQRLHGRLAGCPEPELRERLGLRPDSVVFLYLGRVYREKRLDELLEVARGVAGRTGHPPVEWVILGDGPDLARVEGLARGVPGVRLLGGVYDEEDVARWLRVASAVTIPGKVGLAVNHALAHGVPVLTRESDLHAPEVEYLEHGRNALVVPGTLEDYAEELAALLAVPARFEELGRGALKSRTRLGLDHMVESFDRGVRAALLRRAKVRRGRPRTRDARARS